MQGIDRKRAGLLALVALVAAALPLVVGVSPAAAEGTPDISLAKRAPAQVLYGDTSPVSLAAENETDAWGYNLSFRDVLPVGVSYVPSSVSPATAGEPVILDDQPADGQTTLIWLNVADLAPNNTVTLGYEVSHETTDSPTADCTTDILCVNESYTNTAGAFVNSNPRFVPDFDATTGEPIEGSSSFTGSATDDATSTLVPFLLEKSEPNTEGEILRGVHDHATPYTLTITNNLVVDTNDYIVEDYLPAGLEFLGCGGVDNTTDAPTNPDAPLDPGPDPEYPGAPTLVGLSDPGNCVDPDLVETIEIDPDGDDGPLPFDVYTHVRWDDLADLSPGGQYVLTYLAGIPIRENTLFAEDDTPDTGGAQTANLDNNDGTETFDEQELTNYAEATGTYQGAVAAPGSPTSTVSADLTRTAEDLSVHKSVPGGDVKQGDVVTWTLLIETSEYRYVDDIVVTDTLPNGLCPLVEGIDFDTTEPGTRNECDAAAITGTQNPSTPFSTTTPPVENSNGTWTLTWDLSETDALARMDSSSSVTITFPTEVRTYYQADGEDTTPTVGRDGWNNEVSITGVDYRICVGGDTTCQTPEAKIDGDETDGTPDVDDSGAGLTAPFDTIEKYVAAPVDGAPLATACTGVTDWLDGDAPDPAFSPGDRVCWRLRVNFNDGIDTRNATVTDFIPPNTTYESGSATVTDANTAVVVSGDPVIDVDGETLTWRLGTDLAEDTCTPDTEDCYVEPGAVFDVVFSVIANDDPAAGNAFDIIDNLMKFSAANTVGQVFPLRDSVNYELAQPILGLDKTNDATTALVQGDDVVYSLEIANAGNEPALDIEVWDFLPPEVGCDDVSVLGTATCTPDPTGPDRMSWVIAGPLAPAGSTTLTYAVTMPDGTTASQPVAAGDRLTNSAGVRTFQTETNLGTRIDYFPEDNIDTTVTPNTGAADDTSSVDIDGPSVTKSLETLTDQGGNNTTNSGDDTRGQATIGETVRYTITGTIPANTSAYDADLRDVLSNRHSYVAGSGSVTFPDGTVWNESGTTTLPSGYTYTPGSTVSLALPPAYQNDSATDDVFTITFDVTIDDESANTRTSGAITNRGRLRSEDSLGDALSTVESGLTRVTVVEPLVTVTKSNDRAAPIQGGNDILYTVRVTNSSASRVSTANDLVITDTLPPGLLGADPFDISNGGIYSAGPPQEITWTISSLAPGASVDLTYKVTADDEILAGTTYANDVVVDSTSMPAGDPQGTERSYDDDSSSSVDVVEPPLAKAIDPDIRTIGEAGTATVDFTIPANIDFFDGTLIDELPDGMAFESFDDCTGDAGVCAAITTLGPQADTPTDGQTRIAWFIDDIDPAASPRSIQLTYTVVVADTYDDASPVAAGDDLTNRVAAYWNTTDEITTTPSGPPAPGDFTNSTDPARDTVSVVEPDLAIDKDVAGQVGDTDVRVADVDETLTYTVVVTNATGDDVSAAHDLTVTDVVPDGLIPDEGSITIAGGSYDTGSRTITWPVAGPVAPGGQVSFTYQATVGDSSAFGPGTAFENTATLETYFGVAETERDANPDRDYRTYGPVDDTVTVTPDFPDLAVTKTSGGTATIGVPFTWTVEVTNTASVADALGVDLVDTLPDNWSYVTGTATVAVGGAAASPLTDPAVSGQDLTWTNIADLAPGGSFTVTYQATPAFAARDNADHINTVVTTGDDADGNPANAEDTYTDDATDEPTLIGARLGDFVWEDTNGNGIQDQGEPVLDQVEVTLYAADGTTVILTTTTDPNGLYLFDLLAPGDYVVGFTTPDGYTPTGTDQGDDALDSDAGAGGRSPVVTLAPGEENLTIDAGFFELVSLGDFVWDDLNADGIQDDGEPGIEGVTVRLYEDGNPTPIATTTTGPDGGYSFGDLAPGAYVVEFVTPDGYSLSSPAQGGDTGLDSDADPTTGLVSVTLESGQDDPTIDAGMYLGAAIGDFVWYDLDADGIQDDGEPGIEGVTVELLVGGVVVDSQLTGLDGSYLFADLDPGEYSVRFTAPAGFELSPTGAGDAATDSDADPTTGETVTTTLVSGETDRTWDAGVVGTGSLGDFVWDDQNGDGVQDDSEPGIGGATVTVIWSGPDGQLGTPDDVVVGTETTDPDGGYSVGDLPPGPYRVDVTDLPPGFVETTDLDGTTTPSTTDVDLDPGEDRTDVDFGYQQQADLAIVKTVDDDTLLSGETAVFRLDVTNDGPAQAVGPIVVTDTLPVGFSDATAEGTDWTCDVTGRAVVCTQPGPLASGDSLPQITVTALVDGDAAPSLTNVASVGAETADPNPDNDTDDVPVEIAPAADLTIDKAHAVDAFVVGTPGTYTIQVANQGPSVAVGTVAAPITVTDSVPTGLVPTAASGTGWSCGITGQDVTCTTEAVVPVGGSLPVITLTVDVTTAAEGGVTNTAVVSPGETTDPAPDNNDDPDPTDIIPSADLSIAKLPNGPFTPGLRDSYDLVVTNAGPSADAGPITVVDTYPASLAYVGNLTAGDWDCTDDPDARTVTCTYLPTGPHAVGDLATLTLEFDVDPAVPADEEIVNEAEVSSPTLDPDPGNDRTDGRTTTAPQSDLTIAKSHAGDFQVGAQATWLVAVGNNGPSTVQGTTTVSDDLPTGITFLSSTGTGWSCGDVGGTVTCSTDQAVAPGGSFAPIELIVEVGPEAYPGVTNVATVEAPDGITETNEDNNTDEDPAVVAPLADLAIDKSHDGDFTVGVDGTFTMTVTNLGPNEDPGPLTVVDDLPAGLDFVEGGGDGWDCAATGSLVTCIRPDGLDLDASSSFEVTVSVGTAAEGDIVNRATVSSPTLDPEPTNDADDDPVTVIPSADVSVDKTHAGDFVVGQESTWTLQVTNAGPSTSYGPLVVTDTLPDGFTIVDAGGTGWDCGIEAQDVTCTLPTDLVIGDAEPIVVTVIPQPEAEGPSTNTVLVTPTTFDPNPDNDEATDDVEVTPAFDLVMTKSLESDALVVGSSATYLLSVTNNGPSAAADLVVTDDLPAELAYQGAVGDGWTCEADGQRVSCALADALAAGDVAELRIEVQVLSGAGTSIENLGSVSAAGVELVSADNADSSGMAPVVAAPVPPTPPAPARGALPTTGSDVGDLVVLGLLFTALGGAILLLNGRRRRLV